MPQWLRALVAALAEVLSSTPRTHGGSQLFIMGSDSFFWKARVHADTALIIFKTNKYKHKQTNKTSTVLSTGILVILG